MNSVRQYRRGTSGTNGALDTKTKGLQERVCTRGAYDTKARQMGLGRILGVIPGRILGPILGLGVILGVILRRLLSCRHSRHQPGFRTLPLS